MLVPLTPQEAVSVLVRTYRKSAGTLTHESSIAQAAYRHGVDPDRARVVIEQALAREAEEQAVLNAREPGCAGVTPDTFPKEWAS